MRWNYGQLKVNKKSHDWNVINSIRFEWKIDISRQSDNGAKHKLSFLMLYIICEYIEIRVTQYIDKMYFFLVVDK